MNTLVEVAEDKVIVSKREYEELLWLRQQTRNGVFAATRSVPPPPGPKLDTPQKRLEEKRRREGRL